MSAASRRRFAIASDFDGVVRYWDGVTSISFVSFELSTTDDREKASHATTAAEADRFAEAATELSRCLPPFKARTWFGIELPIAAGRPRGLFRDATVSAAALGMSGLPR